MDHIEWTTASDQDGVHHIKIKVFDKAGNYNYSLIKVITIDNTVPFIPTIVKIYDNHGHNQTFGYFNETMTVEFNAIDTTSGIYYVELKSITQKIAVNNTPSTIVFDSKELDDGSYDIYIIAVSYTHLTLPTN